MCGAQLVCGLDQASLSVVCNVSVVRVVEPMAVSNFTSPFLPTLGYLGAGLYSATRDNRQVFPAAPSRYPQPPPPPPPSQQPNAVSYQRQQQVHHHHQPQQQQQYPIQPPRYTRVNSGTPGSGGKTSVHAVIDYDDDFNDSEDYYEDEPDLEALPPALRHSPVPTVTPIQGPILVKNGSVPVVPLYSYPTLNNGTLVQIPVSLQIFLCVNLK